MFSLTYIHHDCFLLRTPEVALVFDFWRDPLSGREEIPVFVRNLPEELPLYVLVSHFHKDHFNPDIFKWQTNGRNVKYIISRDVARHIRHRLDAASSYKGEKIDSSKVTVLSKSEHFSDSLISVDAFGSTDIGNSYVVGIKHSGLRIFHAGDLNCWTWRDESTAEEIDAAEKAFKSELRPIADAYPSFDVAMFPVDSRIGTGYEEGARLLLENIDVKRFFPMHFELADDDIQLRQRHSDALAFARYSPGHGEFIGLTAPYDIYESRDEGNATEGVVLPELTHRWFLSAGDVNAECQLSLPLLVARLIDIATAHANQLGIGNPNMPNDHCGWVLSRVCVEMEEYPAVDSDFSITTWIESWNRHFSERAFNIQDQSGKTVGHARQVWMVLDTETRANAGLSGLPFNDSYLSKLGCPIPKQGKHRLIVLPQEVSSEDKRTVTATAPVVLHTFRYADLDAYRHVNNVRYIELLMNQFSLAEHDARSVHRLELSFLDEGKYGETVEVLRADSCGTEGNKDEKVSEFLLRNQTGHSPVLYAKVFTLPRNTESPSI